MFTTKITENKTTFYSKPKIVSKPRKQYRKNIHVNPYKLKKNPPWHQQATHATLPEHFYPKLLPKEKDK
jgi:hypothetical protein